MHREILAAWDLEHATLEPVAMGHINQTFRVCVGDATFILQQLNPIFGAEVHNDIEAVTRHLDKHGLRTPRLIRTRAGTLWLEDAKKNVWRLMTFVAGTIQSHAATEALCRSGGALLGRFHLALSDLHHTFSNIRPSVHDTEAHLHHLRETLDRHRHHPSFAVVEPMAEEILSAAVPLSLESLPPRIVHGDPKLNNIVFDENGDAICLIDLDTLSTMTIPVELGDAFRSWCNPTGEESETSVFDLDTFAAGLDGYALTAARLLTPEEKGAIVFAVEQISLELAARFCADALEESYFAYDAARFDSASEHNILRTRSQLSLARDIAQKRDSMQQIAERIFNRVA